LRPRHLPLPGSSWNGLRAIGPVACGLFAPLVLVCGATSATAGTATPDPMPGSVAPDPFPPTASRPALPPPVVRVVHVALAGSTALRPVRTAALVTHAAGRMTSPARPKPKPTAQVVTDARHAARGDPHRADTASQHTSSPAVAAGARRVAALGRVSPLELHVAATLLGVLAVAGFCLAASVGRLSRDG